MSGCRSFKVFLKITQELEWTYRTPEHFIYYFRLFALLYISCIIACMVISFKNVLFLSKKRKNYLTLME
jgi:hypothetical protein